MVSSLFPLKVQEWEDDQSVPFEKNTSIIGCRVQSRAKNDIITGEKKKEVQISKRKQINTSPNHMNKAFRAQEKTLDSSNYGSH